MNLKVLILVVFCAVFTNGSLLRKKRLAEIQNDLEVFASKHIREFRLARSTLHLECYDTYIPEINRIAEEGKNASERCIESAELNKKIVESQVRNDTEAVALTVNKLQQSLTNCQNKSDIISYLECHVGTSDEYKALVDSISTTSDSLLSKLKTQYNAIELEENKCIDTAVNEAKTKTEDTFNNLQFCLSHGLPTESSSSSVPTTEQPTTPTTEPTVKVTEIELTPEPTPEPTLEPITATEIEPEIPAGFFKF